MAPRLNSTSHSPNLVPVTDVPIAVRRDAASGLRTALLSIPLELPSSGKYFATLDRNDVHIFEGDSGIKNFSVPNSARVQMQDGDVHVSVSGSKYKIILHAKAHEIPGPHILLSDLVVPTTLIDEYAVLHLKPSLTASEMDRKRQLAKEIASRFSEAERLEKQQSRGRSPAISSGGESSSFRSGVSG